MVSKVAMTIALAVSAVSAGPRSIEKRITGGEDVQEGEFPSIINLGYFCAGTLLDSTTVLTASHCATGDSFDNERNLVKAGVVNSADDGVVSKYILLTSDQQKSKALPAGEGSYWPNDIAILKLVTPINETDKIKYAKLPEAGSDPKANSTAIAVGWGAQGARKNLGASSAVRKLSKITIPVHPRQTCVDLDPGADGRDTIVCAGGDGKTICKFDSGGPLFDENTGEVIGVSSFAMPDKNGNFCDGSPGVFTRVASYIPFIKENLGGDGGLPTPDYEWTRKATSTLGRHCNRFFNDAATCTAASKGCLEEVKAGASDREVRECADRRQVCADVEEQAKRERCVEKARACIKQQEEYVTGDLDSIEECAKKGLEERVCKGKRGN